MRRALFLVSLLAMLAELVVIRWLASEIRVFAYFKNLPLMAAFFGLGFGCARGRRSWLARAFPFALGAVIGVIAFAGPLGLIHLPFPDDAISIWASPKGESVAALARSMAIVLALFVTTGIAFAGLGEILGEHFDGLPPLSAYSINVAGTLAGIAAFSWISYREAPPLVWVVLTALLALLFDRRPAAVGALAVTLALVALAPAADHWSPYYRIDVLPVGVRPAGSPAATQIGFALEVNHDYHQRALDLSDAFARAHPQIAAEPTYAAARRTYDLPHRFARARERVLIVGAGTGNDVAAALRSGARAVDAVEIDPTILALGRDHPERPYDAPGVRAINSDARAYFRQSAERYDLIVFGLLDSHTVFSSLSSLRLDNYVYTVESFREAHALLTDRGVIAVSFAVGDRPWLGQRLIESLALATGQRPLAFEEDYDDAVCLVAGPGLDAAAAAKLPGLKPWRSGAAAVNPATDDWPFLYHRPGSRPTVYLLVLGAILAGVALVLGSWRRITGEPAGRAGASESERGSRAEPWQDTRLAGEGTTHGRAADIRRAGEPLDAQLFFLGAGFMLVEVKSIAELSLLFGSTWIVNSAVFAGVLVMILIANAVVARFPGAGARGAYAGLALSLLAPLAIGLSRLNALPFLERALAGGTLTCLPIFFAGLIFARSFARTGHASTGLASNLMGTVVGGVLEYTSMAWGIRSLTWVALAIYALSAACAIPSPAPPRSGP